MGDPSFMPLSRRGKQGSRANPARPDAPCWRCRRLGWWRWAGVRRSPVRPTNRKRVGKSGLGLIKGHAYSAPYEDVTIKKS